MELRSQESVVPKNMDLVRSLGAKRVIDYTKEDFTKEKNQKYDIIFDVVGKSSFSKCRKLLTKNGIILEYCSYL